MFNISDASKEAPKAIRKKPHTVIYGQNGVGKSSLCAPTPFGKGASKPIYMNINRGLNSISVVGNDYVVDSYEKAQDFLRQVLTGEHDFQELIIDTADDLEKLIFEYICKEHNKTDLSDFGWGEGYEKAFLEWQKMFKMFDLIRDKRNMQIVILAQCDIKKMPNPTGDTYETFIPKLHGKTGKGDSTAAYLQGWADLIIFLKKEPAVLRRDEDAFVAKNGPVKKKAIGEMSLVMYTEDIGGALAKNRYNMPPKIDADQNAWQKIMHYVDQYWKDTPHVVPSYHKAPIKNGAHVENVPPLNSPDLDDGIVVLQ